MGSDGVWPELVGEPCAHVVCDARGDGRAVDVAADHWRAAGDVDGEVSGGPGVGALACDVVAVAVAVAVAGGGWRLRLRVAVAVAVAGARAARLVGE